MMAVDFEIRETIEYLESDAASSALNNDPYWPKWDSPWWRLMTLFEMGKVNLAPETIVDLLVERINANFIKTFPFYEEDIPKGTDPYRQIPCHCALGTIYQALFAYGIDVDRRLPWLRPWFLKYQLPDGGLNCDEGAYTKSKKSSIVSTLPPLESILYCSPNGLTDAEKAFVDGGARYLIDHHLLYRLSGGLLDPSFEKLSFPRFYDYDFLRGLSYLVSWKKLRHLNDGDEAIKEGLELLKSKVVKNRDGEEVLVEKISYDERQTLSPGAEGLWEWKPARHFPLLLKVSEVGMSSPWLKKYYDEVIGSDGLFQ
jgi:hypothetical protein